MKTGTMVAAALFAVMGLLLTSYAGGQAAYEEKDTEQELEPGNIEDALMEDIFEDELEEEEGSSRYDMILKRSYHYLTRSFIGDHSEWGALPPVKEIFVVNSSGRWMYNNLERINATGEARIIDHDDDGIAELVIWKHNMGTDLIAPDVNNTYDRSIPELENTTTNTNIIRNTRAGFILVYVDRDDNGYPEMIGLDFHLGARYILKGTNTTIGHMKFSWRGAAFDRDQDGDWDVQRFTTFRHCRMDKDDDGNSELMKQHKASYSRYKNRNSTVWNSINAKASKGIHIDRDSDGNPEIRKGSRMHGHLQDRNGDGLPETIILRHGNKGLVDKDSDGNPESRTHQKVQLSVKDKNSDKNPEMIDIGCRSKEIKDRDSDGDWDVIILKYRTYKYVDRDSDGRPEIVERDSGVKYIYPGKETEEKERPEKERKDLEEEREEKKDERQKERQDRTDEENEEERPERPEKDDEKERPEKNEERRPEKDQREPKDGS